MENLMVQAEERRPEVLAELARHPEWRVRMAVAANPCTPAAVLAGLLEDRHPEVQAKACLNPALPPELLVERLPEVNRWIRLALARRRETPEVILRALAADPVEMVREAAQGGLGRML
jgi:hypothetical protein